MLNNEQLHSLVLSLKPVTYKKALSDTDVKLSDDVAALLGQSSRRLVRVLDTVVDAIATKIFTQSINSNAYNEVINEWLAVNKWNSLQRKLWRTVSRDGEAYILVSYENDTPKYSLVEAFDGIAGAAYIYDSLNGNKVRFAVNTWIKKLDYATIRYLDIYYPDSIEKYIYDGKAWSIRHDTPDEDVPIDWTDNNNQPLGIALIKFDIGDSDIGNGAIQIQKDINEALLDLSAVSKNLGFPLRYITGKDASKYLVNQYGEAQLDLFGNPRPNRVKLTPGSIFIQQGNEVNVGQLEGTPTDRTIFDIHLELLSQVTKVPMHYFTGNWPSGEAIIQSETRLNSLVESHQDELSTSIVEMLRLAMKLSNTYSGTSYDATQSIDITFYPPQIETESVRNERQKNRATNAAVMVNAGFLSKADALRYVFPEKTDDEIQTMIKNLDSESLSL